MKPETESLILTCHLYVHISRHIDNQRTIDAFAALAQSTRLDAFRLLVMHEPDGIAAGEIARLLGVPHNTMSTHLAVLSRAGLIRSERQSRSIVYHVDLEQVRKVITFLLKDCCAGHPEVCTPLIADITPCCTPKERPRA
jgi:ArsR family transcriptional regulator